MLVHLLLRLPPAQAFASGQGPALAPLRSILRSLRLVLAHARQAYALARPKSSLILHSPGGRKRFPKWNFLREGALPPPPEPGFDPRGASSARLGGSSPKRERAGWRYVWHGRARAQSFTLSEPSTNPRPALVALLAKSGAWSGEGGATTLAAPPWPICPPYLSLRER